MSGIIPKLLKSLCQIDVEELQRQTETLNGQCAMLRKNVADLEKKLSGSRQENVALQKKLEQANRELEDSYTEGVRLSKEASSLRTEYDRLVSEKKTLVHSLQEVGSDDKNRLDSLQEELIVLKDKIASLQGELQKTRKEQDSSQRENVMLGNELGALRELNSKLIAENGALKQQMRTVTDTNNAESEHLQKEFSILQAEHSRLLASSAEESQKLRDSQVAIQAENDELKEQIVRLEQNLTVLRREGVVMSDKISALRERNLHLNNENKSLHQSIRENGLAKHAELERLQADLASLQAETSRLKTLEADEKMKWQTVYNEMQGENRSLQAKLTKTEQELEAALRMKVAMSEELTMLRDQNAQLTGENRSLQQSVRQENDARKNEVDRLQNESGRLLLELKNLQEKLVRTEQDLSAAQRECTGLTDDVNSLREQNNRLAVENKSLLESLKKDGVARKDDRKSEGGEVTGSFTVAEKKATVVKPVTGMKELLQKNIRQHKYIRVTIKPLGVQWLFESADISMHEKGFSGCELVLVREKEVLWERIERLEGLDSPYWKEAGQLSEADLLEQAICSYRPIRVTWKDKKYKSENVNLYWMTYCQNQVDNYVLPDKNLFVALLSGQCDPTKIVARTTGPEGEICIPVSDLNICQVFDVFQTTADGIEALKTGYQAALFRQELQLADELYAMLPMTVREDAELVSARAIHHILNGAYEEAMKLFRSRPQESVMADGSTWYSLNMENLEVFVNAEIAVPNFVCILKKLQADGWKIA